VQANADSIPIPARQQKKMTRVTKGGVLQRSDQGSFERDQHCLALWNDNKWYTAIIIAAGRNERKGLYLVLFKQYGNKAWANVKPLQNQIHVSSKVVQ
jgi:hypothetical protein